MIGVLELTEEKGRRPVLVQERLGGLRCLRAAVPAARLGENRVRRRVEKGARALGRSGVRRVLTAADFPYWEELRRSGLRPVEVESFCQALAVPLTLAALERQRIPPGQAVVGLWGPRPSRPLLQAAERLCPRVRWLTVEAPGENGHLADWLWREFGAAICPGGGRRPDVVLRFGPGGPEGEITLHLYGSRPDLAGLLPLPPAGVNGAGLDVLPVLALLWEAGYLDLQKIKIPST